MFDMLQLLKHYHSWISACAGTTFVLKLIIFSVLSVVLFIYSAIICTICVGLRATF